MRTAAERAAPGLPWCASSCRPPPFPYPSIFYRMTPDKPRRRPRRLPFISTAKRKPGNAPPSAPAPTASALALVLRMGEYVIGPGFCPQLLGHPDILYRY